MADWFPVISQLKSVVQFVTGDLEGAVRTQNNFSKQCPGVSQVRSVCEVISGDVEAAIKTQKECGRTMGGVIDSVPVVGHVKGVIHYACNDKEGGDNAMKAASRTTGTLGAGAVGFALGGPPGAVVFGIEGAAIMDIATTAVDSKVNGVNGEIRMAGYLKQVSELVDNPADRGIWFDTALMVVGDGATGYAGGKVASKVIKAVERRSQFQHMVERVGKEPARDMVKAADRMRDVKHKYGVKPNKPHVTSVVRDLKKNKLYEGHNAQVRDFCRKPQRFIDSMSDYTDRGPTYLERKVPNARQAIPQRYPRACAEHRAYHKFYKERPQANPAKTRVATVKYNRFSDSFIAVERCDNCKAFGEGMGYAPGDEINGLVVPDGYGPYDCYKHGMRAVGYAGGAALVQVQRKRHH